MKRKDGMLILWPMMNALADFIAFVFAINLGYLVRFSGVFASFVPTPFGVPSGWYYFYSSFFAAGFWVIFMAFRGVYRTRLEATIIHDIARAVSQFLLGFAFLFAIVFFYREFLYSRVVALLALLFSSLLLAFVRIIFRRLRSHVLITRPLHRVLVVGPLASHVRDRLTRTSDTGLVINGVQENKHLSPEELHKQIDTDSIDTIILAFPFTDFAAARRVIDGLGGRRLNFLFVPEPHTMFAANMTAVNIAGLPMIQLREDPLAGWNGMLKRCFDVLLTIPILVLLSPLFALLALLVKLTSRGPVIYRQTRVGLDNRPFTILKFRTMRTDAETKSGPVWATKNDDRTTSIGGFLRRWSLDELPQLWNVLCGDMSLVGPRPERPTFVEKFESEIPRYMERHRVRSGMTGWAQVNGLRGQAPIDVRTQYDIFYVENWSMGFDIWIILKTFVAVVAGRDAY